MNPNHVLKPYVTEEAAKELVLRLYGLQVISVKELVSYDDRNFHITVSPEHSNCYLDIIWPHGYTLKITDARKSAIEGHFQSMHNVMKHMKDRGMRLPFPVRNLKGNTWALEEMLVHGGERGDIKNSSKNVKNDICGVHLLTYIPGVPVGLVRYTEDILYQWGKLLANFHDNLQDYSCPILKKKPVYWDLSHFPEITGFMEGLSERNTSLVYEVLKNFPHRIYSHDSSVKKGLLHGDFNEYNILVQSAHENITDDKYIVDGILDLEDMHYGPYVWDVGVMLAYMMLNCDDLDPIEGIAHTMAGYLTSRSLNEEEWSLLKICIACRLSQSAALGAYSYKLDPQNSYLIKALEKKWSCLELLWKTPNDQLMIKLGDISQMYKISNNSKENQVI